MKTRFAPSPTGWMHFGNLRTALFNFLFARKMQYGFLLRIEDTDQVRSAKEFQDDLIQDLHWLGLKNDEGPYLQSDRKEIYNKYYKELEEKNLAYPCFCSEETLSITRKLQQAAGQPPRYTGTCQNLSKEEIAANFLDGKSATLRFKVPRNAFIEFVDLVKGSQRFASNDIGDFIIRRNDGSASFMFCNAIDDSEMGVTHALRGDDHLTNTPRQIMILNALGREHPNYGHFAMINGSDGAPLSKRNGSQAVRELRAQGYLPLAVLSYLARLGHYYADSNFLTIEQLIDNFDLKNISTSPARHDLAHLRHWQKEAILRSSVEAIIDLIKPYTINTISEDKIISFAELMRENILMPSDAKMWVAVVSADKLDYTAEGITLLHDLDNEFCDVAIDSIKANPSISFRELSDIIKNSLGCKGKELFMPLRLILTGQTHGPELVKLMTFMHSDLLIKRFEDAKNL